MRRGCERLTLSVDHTPPRATALTIAHTLAPVDLIPTRRLPSSSPPFPSPNPQSTHWPHRTECARRQVVLRSKFTDEKHLVYLGWNDRDRARHAPETNATIACRRRRDRCTEPPWPMRRNRGSRLQFLPVAPDVRGRPQSFPGAFLHRGGSDA